MQGSTLEPHSDPRRTARGAARRGLAWIFGGVASVIAAGVGLVLAVVFAASLVVVASMAFVLVALGVATLKARRTMAPPVDPEVIEARNVGGHSWVAYGWDAPR